ncbi:MAG: CaiB/BaiF CoA transferase family protein [Crocinitomicaceae bacterium]
MVKDIEDLIIVEIASVLAGPSVGMFFAELGSRVIKIEPKPVGGDVTRKWKLPAEDRSSSISAYFSSVNYKKEYRLVDFNVEQELKDTIRTIATADILITNFKKGDDLKFKLDYKSLKKMNPNLIYGAINGFGEDSDRVAYDLILQAESGFMSMNGTKDSAPIKMPVALIDVLAGHQLKEGILLALLNREKNGGAKVTVSLFDAAVSSLVNQASNYLMSGHIAEPLGSLHPNIAPYGEIFRTADERIITFAIGSQKQFKKLLSFFKLSELYVDPRFNENSSRVRNRAELSIILSKSISCQNLSDILKFCHQNFVPVAEIKNIKQVFESTAAKAMIRKENIAGIKTKRVSSIAFRTN